MTHSVNYWGSHPDAGNDDCWTGRDYEDPELALDAYLSDQNPCAAVYPTFMVTDCAFIELTGPLVSGIRANPLYHSRDAKRQRALDDAEWQSEAMWQARMGGELSP